MAERGKLRVEKRVRGRVSGRAGAGGTGEGKCYRNGE